MPFFQAKVNEKNGYFYKLLIIVCSAPDFPRLKINAPLFFIPLYPASNFIVIFALITSFHRKSIFILNLRFIRVKINYLVNYLKTKI